MDGIMDIDDEKSRIEKEHLLKYAQMISRRGYISNQLGNIALRSINKAQGESLIFTKHRGISIEEMGMENIVGIGLNSNLLHDGDIPPSIGHALNREIFLHREDVNAVIHVHVDELIAYFSFFYDQPFKFISADAAIILAAPIVVLPPELNVEADAGMASQYITDTNVLVLANHGITTFGKTLSQAYHRLNTMVAEIRRLLFAHKLSSSTQREIRYINDSEEQYLYQLERTIL